MCIFAAVPHNRFLLLFNNQTLSYILKDSTPSTAVLDHNRAEIWIITVFLKLFLQNTVAYPYANSCCITLSLCHRAEWKTVMYLM